MMQKRLSIKNLVATALIATNLAACSIPDIDLPTKSGAGANAFIGEFPYNPLAYHLDLSILAYQLHAQSLVWPFDPFYEELASSARRDPMIAKVQKWAAVQGAKQIANPAAFKAYRGPGSLNGFADNPAHDPILYDYSLLHPWSNTLTNAAGTWTEYLTPKSITAKIKSAHVCARKTGAPEGAVTLNRIEGSAAKSANARDTLWAFEGGTGDKGEAGQPASQSLMGFILLRNKPGGGYDAHIAFRGSRSGSAGRAVKEALSGRRAQGNPDWITDLGFDRITPKAGGALVSTAGEVHRGFVETTRSTLPNLMHCLTKAAQSKGGARPGSVYVTGHSLGGALAQSFVSSVLLGDRLGPAGNGPEMPGALKSWPWANIKLVSFSAPRIGDAEFAQELSVKALQSKRFSSDFNPIDKDALAPNDPAILARLLDKNRPAGFRLLNSKDPVTTQKGGGGNHVGQTVYVNRPAPPDFNAHDQITVRTGLLESLDDPRIPSVAMRYREMSDLNPARVERDKGSLSEVTKLTLALKAYYATTGTWFDKSRFDRNVALWVSIAGED
jgi:hypothetical protein